MDCWPVLLLGVALAAQLPACVTDLFKNKPDPFQALPEMIEWHRLPLWKKGLGIFFAAGPISAVAWMA